MNTQALILADPAAQQWLQRALGDGYVLHAVDEAGIGALLQGATRGDAALLFVQVEPDSLAARGGLIERLAERLPELPVVALGSGAQPEVMLAALRAGARDFLPLQRDEDKLPALLQRVLRRGGAARPASRGRMLAVFSGHADTGVAFLADHLALALVEGQPRNEPVLLVDLSLPAGASLVFLNTPQEYSVLDAIQDAYRCDQTLVDTAFTRHSGGLYLLSLPEAMLGVPALDAGELGAFLDVVRGLFGWVVVSIDGSLPAECLRAVIERAQHSLLLGDQSILNSRSAQHLLRSLRQSGCPLERTGLVVDRYQRRIGLEPARLAELLQLPLQATLGGDGGSRIQAMNSGEPLFRVAPRDEYCAGVRRLAQQFLGGRPGPAPAERAGLLGRWLG